MATSESSVYNSSDLVKDYVCGPCESKTIEESADYFCAGCMKFFCRKCIYLHDQLYANHSKYGREETNKWPLTKAVEDLLLKCDVHKNEKLKMFCQDHSQLCCSDCAFLNHRQCTNVTLICDSVQKMSLDMQQLTINLQTILDELNKFKSTQESSIQSVEASYCKRLQEIVDMRKKLNAALDELENKTLKELYEIRTTLQTALKKDIDNCSRLKDELKQHSEAVNVLCDKSNKEIEFIASRKCLDKMQESESYLKKKSMKVQSSIKFKANSDIEKYLFQQASLGRIVDSLQSLTLNMNPDQILTVKSKSEYLMRISSDTQQTCSITGICCLPSGQVIVTDYNNQNVKLLDQHYTVSSHCDVSGYPWNICQITASEVAVTVDKNVQFISVINGQLVNERKFQLQHAACGIALHDGALYVTSDTALYLYTLNGSLVKKLYVDEGACRAQAHHSGYRWHPDIHLHGP
ncbi:tripartite motif-containing protein 45-like isoform X2 [Dreissena polymorpha]|uniref:tripartite motif-containing protein 45-like isoform X2 n=1 Tax=Dreissena polymorpha TaxID=45954 RepID=UPI002264C560|nr:tripartite motif-containing protein 45-like isoform X2 [Dreissena polymorpha]